MIQANTLMMFQEVQNAAVMVEQFQDGDTMIATLKENAESILIISLKTVAKGYYSLAYHFITNDDEASQDFSLPFPANYAPAFVAAIINDVF
ncbi:hypothetical protein EBOKLHFM_00025 [Klebsiella phage KP13-26]|nr:hypothetical protein EBOKLHFM_00025 [Klebsiella phage KP13-26]